MVVVHIDKDYCCEADEDTNRVGVERKVPDNNSRTKGPKVRFRTLSDDREPSFGGWLIDDDASWNQFWMLDFGKTDHGDTMIEVRRDGKWVQDIG